MPRMEHTENRATLSAAEQRIILEKLTIAETFESFIHTKYQGAKRFSIDGGESLIPMLDTLLDVGGQLGVTEVVIGMAHRGRLNVLANILGKSPDQIFSEFNGPADPKSYVARGDVKYHMGFSSDFTTRQGKPIHLSLAFNPSHLEFVHPVVEGRVRAKQTRLGTDDRRRQVVPLVLHGDASMAGQGVVAETLNLSRLRGYDTGGTVHLVVNNQLGYTTTPEEGRSSIYCTAVAQMLDIPIFHVNGDDPEACVHVMRLATEYRQQFQSDVVVDLVCYRRYGHNEGDEPSYTQPLMYEQIRSHPPVGQLYAKELEQKQRLSAEDAEAIREAAKNHFQSAYLRAKEKSQLAKGNIQELRILGEGLGAEIGSAVLYELKSKPFVPLHDHRGCVVALIDMESKKPIECYRYTAFGEELTNGSRSPWRFSSKRVDETGLVFFGRRYYHPELGRWITQDPQGFEDGPNLYAYVHNRPLTDFDPYGLWSWGGVWRGTKSFGYGASRYCMTWDAAQVTVSGKMGEWMHADFQYEYFNDRSFFQDKSHRAVEGWKNLGRVCLG